MRVVVVRAEELPVKESCDRETDLDQSRWCVFLWLAAHGQGVAVDDQVPILIVDVDGWSGHRGSIGWSALVDVVEANTRAVGLLAARVVVIAGEGGDLVINYVKERIKVGVGGEVALVEVGTANGNVLKNRGLACCWNVGECPDIINLKALKKVQGLTRIDRSSVHKGSDVDWRGGGRHDQRHG